MQEKRDRLVRRFLDVQEKFDRMCEPLTSEEHRIQPMLEVSPPWWSVMHTGWFYARNILMEMGNIFPSTGSTTSCSIPITMPWDLTWSRG